ncbi:hypothetical protein DICPUDRAFT_50997 [Dictyostelium purpureum]|uniref:DDHD domain-containing protein n=1 Tax=Dictyostelium purpureum TaxID=5786 RepID=F1A1F4_DICPU|nr:uncharacterized protein DICPUDRAFT_50997 [Dictyostelium purpureum]EGC29978.1 hypothetical protein DICPUDRAFT_50997 [Dictyostelium purpureum]|eukprot:XP_003293498.1 hypothetical protein DICPUDRAFT_50997 [Dictyostelium purpureum]
MTDNNGVVREIQAPQKSPTMVSQTQTQAQTQNTCPYDHLVILVHGIGKHEKEWTKTIKRINKLFCKIFYNKETENFDKRVKFIGTEWHSTMHNHLGTTIQDVTPTVGIPAVRQIVDDTLLDFLMWSTPTFAEPIYKEVTDQLNQAYHGFIKDYPNFNGRVSILAHSLGSIITYDILTNQPTTVSDNLKTHFNDADSTNSSSDSGCVNIPSFEEPGNISLWRKIKNYNEEKKESFHTNMTFTPLEFPVYNLYIIGSPVGALLSLRKHQQVPIPQCTNMYNIYNTCDPISYLIEPLIDKRFLQSEIEYLPKFTRKLSKLPKKFKKSKKIEKMITNTPNTNNSATPSPCLISAQQQQQQIQQQIQQISISSPNYSSVTTVTSTSIISTVSSSDTSSNSTTEKYSSIMDEEDEDDSSSGDDDQDDEDSSSNDTNVTPVDEDHESKLTRSKENINLFGGFRYDYALKPKGFHISEYGPMLTAHSSYWLSKEVLHFLGAKLLL